MTYKKNTLIQCICIAKYIPVQNRAHLVESVNLLPIGCEIQKACCQINQATNHQIFLAELLLAAAELSSPHHIAVTPLYTDEERIFGFTYSKYS